MQHNLKRRNRIIFTLIVFSMVWIDIIWDYFHGGVPTHYLLHDPNMPPFSNWWGGLLYPLVTWFLLQLIDRNLRSGNFKKSTKLWIQFFSGLVFGAIISISFTLGNDMVPLIMMVSAIVLSLFLPLFFPTYLIGFLLGMYHVFGGVIPVVVGLILTLIFLFTSLLRLIVERSFKKKV